MSDKELAGRIGELMGGPGNLTAVSTCATRLRFNVKDKSKVQRDALVATKGVIQVVESGGQTQVVIGTNVREVYDALLQQPKWRSLAGDGDGAGGKQSFIDWVFGLVSGTFQPLFMPLLGASMIKLVLNVATEFDWYDVANPGSVVLLLSAAANAFFAFLPIFVAATASRRLGASPYLGAAIAAALLDANFLAIGDAGTTVDFLGLPLYLYNYSLSIFPALLIAIALSYLEPFLKRVIHKNLRLLLVPLLSMLILVPLAALVLGPIGVLVGERLADFLTWVNGFSPMLMGAFTAGLFLVMVMFGLHWALLPVIITNFGAGGDWIIPASGGYNFAVWGLAVGVFIRAKRDPELRELAGAGAASGLLAGISEPMLYGVILRFKRVIPIVVGSAVVGGAIIGGFKTVINAFALSSIWTFPLMEPTAPYVVGVLVSFSLALAGVLIFGYESNGAAAPAAGEAATAVAVGSGVAGSLSAPLTIASPMSGKIVPLSKVPDPVFSGGLIGSGVAIEPIDGRVVAPSAGTVIVAPATGHAVGMRTTEGAEILIHIGIDTVNMGGQGFTTLVAVDQQVEPGQTLVEFDMDAIKEAGHPLVTPILVTNATALGSVTASQGGPVNAGSPLFVVTPAPLAATTGTT